MGDRKRFVPVRGKEDNILASALGFNDGYLYFATDTGRIYLDYINDEGTKVARALVGSAAGGAGNSGIFYANKILTADEKLEDTIIFPINSIEGTDYPQKDDIIINILEGSFYRVITPSPLTSSVTALRLTIAGGGGGASTLAEDIDLHIEGLETVNLINGQDAYVYFTATSAKNAKGNEIDSQLTITYTLAYTEDDINYTTYKTDRFKVNSGERISFNFGQYARASSSSRLILRASQDNNEGTISRFVEFSTSKLELTADSTFSNMNIFDPAALTLRCNAVGAMNKIVEYYFDDETIPFYVEELNASSQENREVNVAAKGRDKVSLTHGAHKVWIRLFQGLGLDGKTKGIEVAPLYFEVAINDGVSRKPIIWLGDYKSSYYNYDVIQIPFRVYDPNNINRATVYFKKNNNELDNSPQEITNNTKFSYFEISDAEIDVLNRYSISCGEEENETVRNLEFTVEQDPERTDYGITKTTFLTYALNTVGSGRSNNESEAKRQTLNYTDNNGNIISAQLSNFNWYNNGWVRGSDNKTCLRISNGASLSIPIGQMAFAKPNGSSTEVAHTIELQFKIRNVQDYSNLIRNITRYKKDGDNINGQSGNYELFSKFYKDGVYQTIYTNYDSFLTWYLREHDIPYTDPKTGEVRTLEYDDLEFDYIQKQINLNNVCCGYYNGNTSSIVGLCLGPQDMFFSNGIDTVSATYVEDQIISISIVYQHGQTDAQKLIMIYVNGVLNSVIKNSKSNGFTIESNNIVFNSNSCDIDLYKLRVYNTTLNVNDIVMNYAADFENIDIYDQNKLAKSNETINEYYFDYYSMLEYNRKHPNDPLMPYIIFDTTQTYPKDQQKLSYSKSVKLNIGVEFVNTALDLAYTSGELEELAGPNGDKLWKDGDSQEKKAEAIKIYYKHHCPSWISGMSLNTDVIGPGVQSAVQGTSSEFYPRRNYKLKTKTAYDEDGKSRVHIFLNRGPFQADFEADRAGIFEDKYILSNTAWDANQTYYEDADGQNEVTFTLENPYKYNTYYIKNPKYVKFGDEKTRQDFWYMNNYTVGTTKFTMKIDYMESSGTYNMGFANLVKNGYSKHPLDDYNTTGAFELVGGTVPATTYTPGTIYYYYNHKGNLKNTRDDELKIGNEADPAAAFAMGPVAYAESKGITKVQKDTEAEGYNTWFEVEYSKYTVSNTNEYRTSVQGFRVLAFHKKLLQDGSIYYQYIGMYNMLLDKGSDEAYGFKVKATQKFLDHTDISNVAECWEMENNNRTYCSFRDPDMRKDLTFDAFEMQNGQRVRKLNAVQSAPLVADSFEYRYNADADILDYIYDPIKEGDKYEEEGGDIQTYMTNNGVDFRFDKDNITLNQDVRANFLLNKYSNWEKACQWVWSTCTDYVISQGSYVKTTVGITLWQTNRFYIFEDNEYILDNGEAWDSDITYYDRIYDNELNDYTYANAHVADAAHIFANNKNKFYVDINENNPNKSAEYASCANDPEFNDSLVYYELINFSDTQMAEKEANNEVDRLVRQCTSNDEFNENAEYYLYDGTQINGHATTKVEPTEEEFNNNKTNYYIGITIDYIGNKSYKYDTQEYRADKYINELSKHFDIEYLATYFVMTEVFECYDSRGKNAMFASWGPQEEDGDYIWYPIFYDIDTQLGVNNTGIPSFEYNVDATEDGNYSTSDSVLWNNFYKYFKSSAIIAKYKHLRGVTDGVQWIQLKQAPLYNVDIIEGWYNTDPDVCGQLVMRGKRPIVAKNLDEYYKYITITNGSNQTALDNGLIGHLDSNTSGDQVVDSGQYFYMLQGDRQLSRRQFLDNRLEYIDSWLNQGNYQRGGGNRIRGRVSANNNDTSDKWIEPRDGSYFTDIEETKKRYLFDAEYWVTVKPTHSSYFTLGDDNEAYPSKKYDGINPLKFEISAIKSGVRTSEGYPEQLLYIYGMNNMSDLGDMSKLYWREFSITGKATKLTSLKFGYDGEMDDPNNPGVKIKYKNNGLNNFSINAEKTDDDNRPGLPLLKYMNMSYVNLSESASTTVLDLTSCEKLENFRATGSNFTEIKFAKGVALNTLHLPTSIVRLELVEARLLKNLITEYQVPELNSEGELVAQPGLYLEGMFENNITNITTLNILGSGLGYDSYKLLKKYYDIRKEQTSSSSNIQMTNVQWSPYIKVSIDEPYDPNNSYFEDNGHYGLISYNYNVDNWNIKVSNGEIYRLDSTISINNINQINDDTIEMLRNFANTDSVLFRTDENNNIPTITGYIYINNTIAVNESDIRNNLQPAFSDNLKFFFANVNEAYTAKFLLMDADSGEDGTYTLVGSQTIESGWFTDPITLYGDISKMKQNHDFYGWALTNSRGENDSNILINIDRSINKWNTQTLDENKHTYYFYAICPIHKWEVNFYDGQTLIETVLVEHEGTTSGPINTPYKDDSDLPLEQTYQLLGYNRNANATEPMENLSDFAIIGDTNFYAVWNPEPISVYQNIHPEFFEITQENTIVAPGFGVAQRTGVTIALTKAVRGKLTIPTTINGKNVVVFQSQASIDYNNTNAFDPLLENVTHVFFEKNVTGQTTIAKIDTQAFQYCSNLRYFEFANGLYIIGSRAFFGGTNNITQLETSQALKDTTIISGTVQDLGDLSFTRSYNITEEENKDLIIDGNIRVFRGTPFSNNIYAHFNTLQIGTNENKTQITNFSRAFLNSQNAFKNVVIYTANPNHQIFDPSNNYELLLQALFGPEADLTMPITVIS